MHTQQCSWRRSCSDTGRRRRRRPSPRTDASSAPTPRARACWPGGAPAAASPAPPAELWCAAYLDLHACPRLRRLFEHAGRPGGQRLHHLPRLQRLGALLAGQALMSKPIMQGCALLHCMYLPLALMSADVQSCKEHRSKAWRLLLQPCHKRALPDRACSQCTGPCSPAPVQELILPLSACTAFARHTTHLSILCTCAGVLLVQRVLSRQEAMQRSAAAGAGAQPAQQGGPAAAVHPLRRMRHGRRADRGARSALCPACCFLRAEH